MIAQDLEAVGVMIIQLQLLHDDQEIDEQEAVQWIDAN